jgi:hypothetical protein
MNFGERIMDWICDHLLPWFIILCIVAIFVMVGVGVYAGYQDLVNNDPITEGVVVDKQYYPPSTSYIQSGKVMVPITMPERYVVTLQGITKNKHVLTRHDYTLTRDQWEQTPLGATLPVEEK